MELHGLIDQLRIHEHRSLIDALRAADEKIAAIQRRIGHAPGAAPAVDMWGDPIPVSAKDLRASPGLGRLARAWHPLSAALAQRIEAWNTVLRLACPPAGCPRDEAAIRSRVEDLMRTRHRLEMMLREVREASPFVNEARADIVHVLSAVARCDRIEQNEIFPLLNGCGMESSESTSIHSSIDVVRNLRASGAVYAETGRESWLSWLKRVLLGR